MSLLEIALGIDNIIFITILAGKLPEAARRLAIRLGLGLAMLSRIALLLGIVWVMRLTEPLFSILQQSFSGKDLILLGYIYFALGFSLGVEMLNLRIQRSRPANPRTPIALQQV